MDAHHRPHTRTDLPWVGPPSIALGGGWGCAVEGMKPLAARRRVSSWQTTARAAWARPGHSGPHGTRPKGHLCGARAGGALEGTRKNMDSRGGGKEHLIRAWHSPYRQPQTPRSIPVSATMGLRRRRAAGAGERHARRLNLLDLCVCFFHQVQRFWRGGSEPRVWAGCCETAARLQPRPLHCDASPHTAGFTRTALPSPADHL